MTDFCLLSFWFLLYYSLNCNDPENVSAVCLSPLPFVGRRAVYKEIAVLT